MEANPKTLTCNLFISQDRKILFCDYSGKDTNGVHKDISFTRNDNVYFVLYHSSSSDLAKINPTCHSFYKITNRDKFLLILKRRGEIKNAEDLEGIVDKIEQKPLFLESITNSHFYQVGKINLTCKVHQ